MARPETEARRLREEFGGSDIPVPVDLIAERLDVTLVVERLDRNVSGLLFRRGEEKAIGINATHSPQRQRFTVAHELGHLRLHPGRELILDHVRVNLRDDVSSLGTDREEREANAFAAELLMPAGEITRHVRWAIDREQTPDARLVGDLGRYFDVSDQAMEFRLVHLGLWRQI